MVRALIAGQLPANIDPRQLFASSLTSNDAARTRAVLRMIDDPDLRKRAKTDPALLGALAEPVADLAVAQAEFLSLPVASRQRLIDDHSKRAAALREAGAARQENEQNLIRLQRTAAALQDFLAGKPADPAALSINLLDPQGPGLESARRRLLLNPAPIEGAPIAVDTGAEHPITERITQWQRRVDSLRGQILALAPEQLQALLDKAGITPGSTAEIAEAQATQNEAARQKVLAEEAARDAKSELARLIANERARLLAVKAAQAAYRAELVRQRGAPQKIMDEALGWRRKVRELSTPSRLDRRADDNADALYSALVGELQNIRGRLGDSLSIDTSDPRADMLPPQLDDAVASGPSRSMDLLQLRQSLEENAQRLEQARQNSIWDQRHALHEAMVLLNETRLNLIPGLSATKRARLLGFGDEGIAQVRREAAQISFDLRYNLLSLNRHLAAAVQPIFHPTPAFVFELLRLLIVALLFRWWRKAGEPILRRSEMICRVRRPQSIFDTAQATLFSYFRRVRRPLDWLLFALLLRWLMPVELAIAGMNYVWIITIWVLSTAFLIRLANELARGNRQDDPRAELRWKSLRLVAGSLLGVGLVLALTSASVGEGAIYSWVLGACWLLAPPILFLLAHWWRGRIVTLAAAGADNSTLLAWCARNPGGMIGAVGRVAAGGVLLMNGLRAVIVRRANDIVLIREIFDQRARVRAARQVADDEASGLYQPLNEDQLDQLDPHQLPQKIRGDDPRPGGLTLPVLLPGSVTAIVGERGLGKSAVLRDIGDAASIEGRHIHLEVDRSGLAGIMSGLAKALSLKTRGAIDGETVAKAIGTLPHPVLITIDDVQRLIVPAIGGLADLDALIAMARSAGTPSKWVLALGGPAWSYVSRARSDRVMFDSIVSLPRWNSHDLRTMIERRTAQAGLEPDFSRLSDYSAFQFDGDIDPVERKRRGYFERLADYSNGNPAMALEFWRRSLFIETASGNVVVRVFATPEALMLAALPLSAMFVLRAILQMDAGYPAEIERSTDLSPIVVADGLRSLVRLGVVFPFDAGYRIALNWWSEVVRLLERQNLIVRGAL